MVEVFASSVVGLNAEVVEVLVLVQKDCENVSLGRLYDSCTQTRVSFQRMQDGCLLQQPAQRSCLGRLLS
jgi:hypothetical protein